MRFILLAALLLVYTALSYSQTTMAEFDGIMAPMGEFKPRRVTITITNPIPGVTYQAVLVQPGQATVTVPLNPIGQSVTVMSKGDRDAKPVIIVQAVPPGGTAMELDRKSIEVDSKRNDDEMASLNLGRDTAVALLNASSPIDFSSALSSVLSYQDTAMFTGNPVVTPLSSLLDFDLGVSALLRTDNSGIGVGYDVSVTSLLQLLEPFAPGVLDISLLASLGSGFGDHGTLLFNSSRTMATLDGDLGVLLDLQDFGTFSVPASYNININLDQSDTLHFGRADLTIDSTFPSLVPEPGTLLLLVSAMILLILYMRSGLLRSRVVAGI